MASRSLLAWGNESTSALDEIEHAHAAVGGHARGRRYATQQINQAYLVLLSSRFQRFCRDLHSETVAELIRPTGPAFQPILQRDWTQGRKLDQGNPNAGNIGHDFQRLGLSLWSDLKSLDPKNDARRASLDLMIEWRNAIGHQDFNKKSLNGRTSIQLRDVRGFRRNCGILARFFDQAALDHIHAVAGPSAGW